MFLSCQCNFACRSYLPVVFKCLLSISHRKSFVSRLHLSGDEKELDTQNKQVQHAWKLDTFRRLFIYWATGMTFLWPDHVQFLIVRHLFLTCCQTKASIVKWSAWFRGLSGYLPERTCFSMRSIAFPLNRGGFKVFNKNAKTRETVTWNWFCFLGPIFFSYFSWPLVYI